MLPRITDVSAVGGFRVSLRFTDGVVGTVDLRADVEGRPGLFRQLNDPGYFRLVAVDVEAGTIAWPNGLDLDPDVLYHRASGSPLPASSSAEAAARA
jgi:hypothetical protein